MSADELAGAEQNLIYEAEVIARTVSPLNPWLATLLDVYNRLKRERDEVRKEVVDTPDATHEQTMSTLRWLWGQEAELGEMRPQWENRFEVIKAVADAAGHVDEYPGRGLAEHVAGMRADLARALPVVEAAGALVEHFGPSGGAQMTAVARRLLDALARELDAGKGTG